MPYLMPEGFNGLEVLRFRVWSLHSDTTGLKGRKDMCILGLPR